MTQRGRIQTAKMRFLRVVKCFDILDRVHNEEIGGELDMYSLVDDLDTYRWKGHVKGMAMGTIPKAWNTCLQHGEAYEDQGKDGRTAFDDGRGKMFKAL